MEVTPVTIMKQRLFITSAFLLLTAFCLSLGICSAAVENPAESEYPRRIILHRVTEGKGESLCTPVARYADAAGRSVDLVGAVHLAEASYYRALNRAFARYDKVLYEMVDGEGLPEQMRLERKVKEGKATAAEKARYDSMKAAAARGKGAAKMLTGYYAMMSDTLCLQQQTEHIDYGLPNMVFADMSMQELQSAMSGRGESWFSLAMDSMRAENSSSGVSFSRSSMRREVIRALARSSQAPVLAQSSIIVSRNERCFEVLDKQLASASAGTRIAIFYGAMHLRDMHRRLLARGFTLQGVQWLTAMRG